jgi:hypothetical protein
MVTLCGSRSWVRREAGLILVSLVILFPFSTNCWASGPDEAPLDATVLSQMEQHADAAQPRDQCYLFTEVLHGLTELAGRQMAAGDGEDASVTLQHIDEVAAKVQNASSANAKRLKNAELLFEHTTRRLTDMVHVASSNERATMQATLQHLDKVHTQLLAMVFSK